MGNKTSSSFAKRQKEMARQARQKEKQARRLDAKQKGLEGEADPAAPDPDDDPDLAGIVLGPQAPVDDFDTDDADDTADERPAGRDKPTS